MTTVNAVPVGPSPNSTADSWGETIAHFESMGFDRSDAERAVAQAGGELERALNLLIEADDQKKAAALFGEDDAAVVCESIACVLDSSPPLGAEALTLRKGRSPA